jgi:hypothetical protein
LNSIEAIGWQKTFKNSWLVSRPKADLQEAMLSEMKS